MWVDFYQDQIKDYYKSRQQKPKQKGRGGSGGAFAIKRRGQAGGAGGKIGSQYRAAGSYILPLEDRKRDNSADKQQPHYTLTTAVATAVERAKSELESADKNEQSTTSNQIASSRGIRTGSNKTTSTNRNGSNRKQQQRKAGKRKQEGSGVSKSRKAARYDDIFSR